jgi:hypothetical protein
MEGKKPKVVAQRPAPGVNLQREINRKLFAVEPKPGPSRPGRDPITQLGIAENESEMPSKSKPRGLAQGSYSVKGQGSFTFEQKDLQAAPERSQLKKAQCAPAARNPITQEHARVDGKKGIAYKEEYAKVRDSTLFVSASETNLVKQRDNQ